MQRTYVRFGPLNPFSIIFLIVWEVYYVIMLNKRNITTLKFKYAKTIPNLYSSWKRYTKRICMPRLRPFYHICETNEHIYILFAFLQYSLLLYFKHLPMQAPVTVLKYTLWWNCLTKHIVKVFNMRNKYSNTYTCFHSFSMTK